MTGKLLRPSGDRSARRCGDPDRARLVAERAAVIELEALLILPLMHHLVEERVRRFLPAVAPDMPPADRDFSGSVSIVGRVVTKSRSHAARHSNQNRLQRTVEPLRIVDRMQATELAGQRLVARISSLRCAPSH